MNRTMVVLDKIRDREDVIILHTISWQSKRRSRSFYLHINISELENKDHVIVKDAGNYAELQLNKNVLSIELCWISKIDDIIYGGHIERLELPYDKLQAFLQSNELSWKCLSLKQQKQTKIIFKCPKTIAKLREQNRPIYNKLFKHLLENYAGCEIRLYNDWLLTHSFTFECLAPSGYQYNGGIVLNNYDKQRDCRDAYYSSHT